MGRGQGTIRVAGAGIAALLGGWTAAMMAAQDAGAAPPVSWLQVCPAGAAAGVPSAPLALPDGPALVLRAGPQQPGCAGVTLPVAPADIAALRTVAPADRAADARTLLVYRPEPNPPGGAFGTVETVQPPAAAPSSRPATVARTAAPLRRNVLEQLQLRPYGVEERVQAQWRDGRLSVQCRAGEKPAGVLLSAPWTMPQAALALALQYHAGPGFTWSLADEAASRGERALELGMLPPAPPGQPESAMAQALLPLPASGWNRGEWRHFALACPYGDATLAAGSLQLLPQPRPGSAPARATWVWRAKAWLDDPAAVLAAAHRHGMQTLFITVPTQGASVPQPGRLAAFARQAARAGVALWAVEGDPHMALPAHHAATVDRVRAIAAYNRGVEPAARLHGVQFDIEPYLLDGYGMAAARHDDGYAQLLGKLKAAAGGLPLDFVVPFWWHGNATVLAALAKAASVVTVMDYRTDEEQIRDFATPFLDWGARHQVGVRIALEAGHIAPERQHRYVRADGAAELWAVTLAPEQSGLAAPLDVLVLLKQPHAGFPGTGFRYAGNRLLDGSATTFVRQPERLQALLPQLQSDFHAWPTFAGIAVHEPGDAVPAPVKQDGREQR